MRHSKTVCLAVAAMLVSAWSATAQQPSEPTGVVQAEAAETNRGPIIPFLEGTDVFWTLVQKDKRDTEARYFPNKLEANIFPHLVVYQNFSDVLDAQKQFDKRQVGARQFAVAISGTPAVRLRMLQDRSAPVRTPSYMPRGNFQVLFVRGLEGESTNAARDAPNVREFLRRIPRVSIWEGHVIAGHHSNGQDGCLSTDQDLVPEPPDPAATCTPPGIVPTAASINRRDGSFSSAFFFRFGANYSRNWLRDVERPAVPQGAAGATALPVVERVAYVEWRASAEYEYHPRPWVDEQMRDIYGRHRMNLGAAAATKTVRACQRRFEGSVAYVWNPGAVDAEGPDASHLDHSFSVQASCFPWMNGGWGFFVRYYTGQDYYNVGFLDQIKRVHIGMTFNQSDFFRFRSGRREGK